jgi:hypothetical protein
MKMTKTNLLSSVCAIVLLAAVPALAQTTMKPADTGIDNTLNNPTGTPNGSGMMTPADKMGSTTGSHASMNGHSAKHASAMHGSSSMPQTDAVDQLNNQSYQAALNGKAFNGMTPPGSSSASMNDMGGGSMARTGTTGGTGGNAK